MPRHPPRRPNNGPAKLPHAGARSGTVCGPSRTSRAGAHIRGIPPIIPSFLHSFGIRSNGGKFFIAARPFGRFLCVPGCGVWTGRTRSCVLTGRSVQALPAGPFKPGPARSDGRCVRPGFRGRPVCPVRAARASGVRGRPVCPVRAARASGVRGRRGLEAVQALPAGLCKPDRPGSRPRVVAGVIRRCGRSGRRRRW